MPPTLISRDLDEINSFRDEHGAVVDEAAVRPWRRRGVPRHAAGHEFRLAVRHVLGHLPRALGDPALPPRGQARRQAHHPGRRRIRRRASTACRRPTTCAPTWCAAAPRKATELSAREREICDTLGPALRERGLLFVGIDVIDGNLTEINVTSPTGIRAIAAPRRPGMSRRRIWDTIEKKRGGK